MRRVETGRDRKFDLPPPPDNSKDMIVMQKINAEDNTHSVGRLAGAGDCRTRDPKDYFKTDSALPCEAR